MILYVNYYLYKQDHRHTNDIFDLKQLINKSAGRLVLSE